MLTLYDFIEARERLSTVTVKTKLIHSTVFPKSQGMMYILNRKIYSVQDPLNYGALIIRLPN